MFRGIFMSIFSQILLVTTTCTQRHKGYIGINYFNQVNHDSHIRKLQQQHCNKKHDGATMSQPQMGNSKTKNIPPAPPPPLRTLASEKPSKIKTKDVSNKSSPLQIRSKTSSGSNQSSQGRQVPALSTPAEESVSQEPTKVNSRSESRKLKGKSDVEIVRNDVLFFNEEECTDSEDEFSFTCCTAPNSPRFPPNPRPKREWDPSFLPSSTNIPASIGRKCRRCGKPVYLAELYLSSRGVYHTECYKCCLCGKPLDSWSVAEYRGEVFCKGCYRRNFGQHGVGFGVGAGTLQTP